MALLKTRTGLSRSFTDYATGNHGLKVSSALRFEDKELTDMGSLIGNDTLSKMIKKTVVAIDRWSNPSKPVDVSAACGMSIYCPRNGIEGAYNDTLLAKSTGWVDMIMDAR